MADSPITVGQKIRRLRKKNRWSMLLLSKKAKVSEAMVVKVELGQRQGSLLTLKLIANALDRTLPELLSGTEYDGLAGDEAKSAG